MNDKAVMITDTYDRIDGRNAYRSKIMKLTLGAPVFQENQVMQIAAQIWKENADGKLEISTELPIHQVIDLMIFLSCTLLYFREAYRLPLLYDPQKPIVERIGLQGDVMPLRVCTENPAIDKDIQAFSQAINDLAELTGERLRVLYQILEEMEYC